MFVDRREAGRRLAALLAPFTAERPVVPSRHYAAAPAAGAEYA